MCRSFVLWFLMALGAASSSPTSGGESVGRSYATVRNSNAAILNRLGLVPVRLPEGHHKKRLAGPEPSGVGLVAGDHQLLRLHQPYSRRHGSRDSHVYIVKLPASQPYYSLTKPHKPVGPANEDKIPETRIVPASSGPQVGFHSNGKPGKIYHWNLPMMKKINEKKRLHAQLRIEQMRRKLETEIGDRHRQHQHQRHSIRGPSIDETVESDRRKKPAILAPASRTPSNDFNGKRYHHHSTSVNALHLDEKPAKHVRNNDKRLSYPRVSEELRKSGGRPEKLEKFNATSGKTYRLEDSSLYRLGVGGLRGNDRLAGWKLGNEVHASVNSLGGSSHAPKPKKHRKKAAMSYYAPINAAKTAEGPTNIERNFPGNGKPKAFYVMEKSRQPVYYHPLLP